MDKIESIEDFYQRRFGWIPENLKNEIGHFNVFPHRPVEPGKSNPLPYKRRDFFKIMLVVGNVEMNYADKVVTVKKQAIFFPIQKSPISAATWKISSQVFTAFSTSIFSINMAT